jgi:hypothetical protein
MIMNIIEYYTDVDPNQTSRQGIVNTTYDKLVSILGEPTYVDIGRDEKVNCEWSAKVTYQDPLSDDPADTKTEVVTIYNWCTGSIPYTLYPWHIGGHNLRAEELVHAIIRNEIKPVE